MRYLALASSFDETIAHDGRIEPATSAALRRLVASGRQLILVSRRTVAELDDVVPSDLFAVVVAEHGGLLWRPAAGATQPLGPPLPHGLVAELRDRGVADVRSGHVAVTTDRAHEAVLRQAVAAQGLDLHVVADKDIALALPPGVDKGTGLAAAIAELGLSPHEVVGIGDAETDLPFLRRCECAVAVANAPDAVHEACDIQVDDREGHAVVRLVDRLVDDDLADVGPCLDRHRLLLGSGEDGDVTVPSHGANLLLAGTSGTGKSTLVAGLLQRLLAQHYQLCVLDPEGDHAGLEGAVTVGGLDRAPDPDEVAAALGDPDVSVVVNLLAVRLPHLSAFLRSLLGSLLDLRASSARPHALVLDEAHHFLPLPGEPGAFVMPRWFDGVIMSTVNPEHISPTASSLADTVVVFGRDAGSALGRYCAAIGEDSPVGDDIALEPGRALAWHRSAGSDPVAFAIAGGDLTRGPHLRRWAQSELPPDKSFHFTGPDERLALRAPTLALFAHLAEGVDEDTWRHHLDRGEYSAWIRDDVHDETLAEQVAVVERDAGDDSRARVLTAIRERYAGAPT